MMFSMFSRARGGGGYTGYQLGRLGGKKWRVDGDREGGGEHNIPVCTPGIHVQAQAAHQEYYCKYKIHRLILCSLF